MTEELSKFKDSLKEKTADELKELEQQLIKESEEKEESLKTLKFDLPKKNLEKVADSIVEFLNKYTVTFQYTLIVVELVEFWANVKNEKSPKIQYYSLDKTLRILGELKFTGYKECKDIVDINKYFEGDIKDKYIKASNELWDISSKHNLVMDELQLKVPIQPRDTEAK